MKIKTVLLGDSAVGKTHLLSHLDERLRSPTYVPTIGIDFIHYVEGDNRFHIWDTSGNARFSNILIPFIRDASLFILVYNSKASFLNLKRHIHLVKASCRHDYRIVLLSFTNDVQLESQGQMMASSLKIPFFTSTLDAKMSGILVWESISHFCTYEQRENHWMVEKNATEVDKEVKTSRASRWCLWY